MSNGQSVKKSSAPLTPTPPPAELQVGCIKARLGWVVGRKRPIK